MSTVLSDLSSRYDYVLIDTPPVLPVTDTEAMDALALLSRREGIIPAIESAHALAGALKLGKELGEGAIVLVSLSGRGDKDIFTVARHLGVEISG